MLMDTGLPDDNIDHNTHSSVVLHVDLDCFYAAVEHVRLGIPRDVPLAVQQWEGLIAINYAARAAGITRHERVHQAMKKCPELQCVHVETIGDESGNLDAPDRGQAKVSLERYRQASASVFKIFHQFSDVCEKASIDEAYLDVTSRVEKMMNQGCNWDQELHRLIGDPERGSEMIVVDGPLVPFNSYDRRMLAGAIIAEKIRSAVRKELGYTCSVGIATNKLLAKIASAKNKPDKQTLVPPRAVPGLMQSMPLKKVKLLGGKLGEEMTKKWGVSTAGEAQAIPLAALVGCFGERLGNYIWHAVRGIQTDKVQVKQVAKSMLAAKSFNSTKELTEIRRWLSILAEELSVRMVRDFKQNHRHPRLLQLYYRSGDLRNSRDHTKSWAMPHAALSILSAGPASPSQTVEISNQNQIEVQEFKPGDEFRQNVDQFKKENMPDERAHHSIDGDDDHEGHSKDLLGLVVSEQSQGLARVLEIASYSVFKRLEGTFPCSRLALAAGGFQDLQAPGTKSIQHFFTSVARGGSNSSPVQNVGGAEPRKPSSPIKGRAKGMLKFLKHEAPSAVLEERRGDAEEHSDDQRRDVDNENDVVRPNQLGEGDHKPLTILYKAAPLASKAKPKGMYKFFSQNESHACKRSGIFETGVNLREDRHPVHGPPIEHGNTEVEGEIEGLPTAAFGTDLEIFRAKEPTWKLDAKADLFALGDDDELRYHQSELPPSHPVGKVELSTPGFQRYEPSSKGETGEVDTKKQIAATSQHSVQPASQLKGESRAQGVVTPVKRPLEYPLKPHEEAKGVDSPTPGKRSRQSASKTGQLSIAKFFRIQEKT